jgi:hypothetical protein
MFFTKSVGSKIPCHLILEEPRMFWFDNLEQSDKDNSVQLLSQGIQYYNGLHQNVLDMETKFGITFSQSQELYEYLYLKENVMVLIIFTLIYLEMRDSEGRSGYTF